MTFEPAPTKILYIDDDPNNRALVNRLLTSYDFTVLEAETGLDGIQLARAEKPHLILMDINMPGLDGHETTTRMRSIPALEKIPIVAVTARTTKGERQLAIAAGCDGFITKPIDIDRFPEQVLSYLDGQRDTLTMQEHQHYLNQYSRKLVDRLETKIIELQEVNGQLQKVDKLKTDFITLAAHELRTPITLVYGYTRLLQSTMRNLGASSAESGVGELADRIFESVHRLNEVVNDILNIALIESDEMHLVRQSVDLAEVVEAALRELDLGKTNRNLNISLEALDGLPHIQADPRRLQQVFWNLLSNAIKFTPDGGYIVVKGWLVDTPHPGITIAVRDTGIGINAADHDGIFEQFYIVGDTAYHSTSKTAFRGGGMGLGLPIARGIVAAHGGRIWVESEKHNPKTNPGTTFYVYLPQTDDAD